jgi:site-specific recombinase XerD
MLSRYFTCPIRLQQLRNSPDYALLEGFADQLWQTGYARTVAQKHIGIAEHFIYWANRQDIAVGVLNESSIENFDRHLCRCRCECPCHGRTYPLNRQSSSTHLFLGYVRGAGIAPRATRRASDPEPALFGAFSHWMRQQRGTCNASLRNYSYAIRDLLKTVGDNPNRFDAQRLRKFVLERCQRSGPGARKSCITAVRMFLRFLIADGSCRPGLDGCIPTLAHWRLSSLPGYLQPEDVKRIIESCDVATPVGLRDRAILLLLARMGLRAGDVARLSLEDLDWKQAWIQVSGKGRRQTRLPLTQEVGDALVRYLRESRPGSMSNTLFIRHRAPFHPFRTHSAISMVVSRAMQRAGVACPSRGAAHLFRHSAATSMLRHGTSLQDIGAILRHRLVQTTAIYAKVDVTALRTVAQPWPEVKSC